jgi:hypothetical protein
MEPRKFRLAAKRTKELAPGLKTPANLVAIDEDGSDEAA